MEIHTLPTADQLAEVVAKFIGDLGIDCIAQRGQFSLVLSGGGTPRQAYQRLAQRSQQHEIDWSRVHVFWGDERCVPLDHEQSNFRMARESLFELLPSTPDHLYPMTCSADAQDAADQYEQTLRKHFPDQDFPPFDLILLGLGTDGHTASLFPETEILRETRRWVAPIYVPALESWRISLTLPVINAASHAAFLVSGEEKAPVIQHILEHPEEKRYPAQQIDPQGTLHWFMDQSAGRLLKQSSS